MKHSKNIIKTTLKVYKKKFYYFLLIDILFFSILFFFLVYARNKMQNYITLIQQLTPDLMALQNTLQQSTDLNNLLQLETLLNSINEIVKEAFIFGYFIFPLVLFLLWIISQGLDYRVIKEDKLKQILNLKYFLKFALFTLPFFIILILLFIQYLKSFDRFVGYYGGVEKPTFYIYLLLVIPLIMFYFLTILYRSVDKLKDSFERLYNSGIKKFYITIPLFLPFLIAWILLLIFFLNIHITYIAESFGFSILPTIILVFLLILFISIYRLFFTTFLDNL